MNKKCLLWVSEASFLNTGFSGQSRYILDYLYKTGKYEICELGSYAQSSDPRANSVPWQFYGAIPDGNNEQENRKAETYEGQFGAAVFERVLLDFNPTHVIDIRDPFFMDWQLKSPYRKFFNLIWQPTVDSEPQQRIWIDNFKKADTILTLSRYGKEVLERESDIKIADIASPGADEKVYFPQSKEESRKVLGLPQDCNILLNVARNQKRKLFPDLIEIFRDLLEKFKRHNLNELYQKTFLYLHTSYPDVGFDLGRFIMQNGLSSKVLLTYSCKKCSHIWADFWQTEMTVCPRCHDLSAFLTNTNHGIPSEVMAKIYNASDAFISYSICEGLGMPCVEAKMCGLPLFAVNYSATAEQVECEGCYPIDVVRYFHEPVIETQQMRCYPDNKDALRKLFSFFVQPKKEWSKHANTVRKHAIDNYSFERAAKIFEKAIDNSSTQTLRRWDDINNTYFLPLEYTIPNTIRSNAELVDYLIEIAWRRPEMKQSEFRNNLVRSLNVGYMAGSNGREKFSFNELRQYFNNLAIEHNFWEHRRLQKFGKESSPVVRYEKV